MRELLEGLNEKMRQMNASAVPGPPLNLMPYDVDEFVRDKRQGRPGPEWTPRRERAPGTVGYTPWAARRYSA